MGDEVVFANEEEKETAYLEKLLEFIQGYRLKVAEVSDNGNVIFTDNSDNFHGKPFYLRSDRFFITLPGYMPGIKEVIVSPGIADFVGGSVVWAEKIEHFEPRIYCIGINKFLFNLDGNLGGSRKGIEALLGEFKDVVLGRARSEYSVLTERRRKKAEEEAAMRARIESFVPPRDERLEKQRGMEALRGAYVGREF